MYVLHLIESSEPGGAETVLLSIAKGLRTRGHSSVVALLQPGWLHDQLERNALKTFILHQNTAYDLGCLRALRKIIRGFKIDLIHAHEFMMNTYGSLAGLYEGVPVISTVHGKNYYWLKRRRRLAYRLVSRLSTMVAVCEDIKNLLVRRVGVSRNRITTIYNGIDCEPFDHVLDETAIATMKADFAIPGDTAVIGTVGMLVPEKDHMTLLKAARLIIDSQPNALFLVVGSGPLEESLRAEVFRAKLDKHVRFVGFQRNVASFLRIMDVYVCSSASEGLPLCILEAMVAARPVVATNVGGNPEMVLHNETGLLVPPANATALAWSVNLLLQDRHLARQMCLNAQRLVYQRFTLRHMVESYEELYHVARSEPRKRLVAIRPFG